MYRAKALGEGQVTVLEEGNEANTATLITELTYAVSHGLIRPYIRSVVDLHTGVLVAYQGLARWAHPERGLLDAEHFIHSAATTPLIPVIDLDVLRRTATEAARRQRDGLHIHAYAHLSRRLLGDDDLDRYLSEIIDAVAIAPRDVRVEIAHTLLTRRSRTVNAALRSLRDLGVRTVLAGVDGECGINEIVEHGFDELRLAHHLVHDTASDATRRRVAEATIALARSLGLTVTAVGIESQADHDHMRDPRMRLRRRRLLRAAPPTRRSTPTSRLTRVTARHAVAPGCSDWCREQAGTTNVGRNFVLACVGSGHLRESWGSCAGTAKRVGPHTLRHAFITAALNAGVPLRDVQESREPRLGFVKSEQGATWWSTSCSLC